MASTFHPYSDRQLLEAMSVGEELREEIFRELYRRHARPVFVYVRRILDDDALAEDTLQETFIDFLRYALSGQDVQNVPAFLFRIARNRCLNLKRSLRSRPQVHDDSFFEREQEVHDDSGGDDMVEQLREALGHLSEEQREAVVLQMYNGMSYKEIADLMEVPLTTVRNRIARAKTKLRLLLEPYRNQQR